MSIAFLIGSGTSVPQMPCTRQISDELFERIEKMKIFLEKEDEKTKKTIKKRMKRIKDRVDQFGIGLPKVGALEKANLSEAIESIREREVSFLKMNEIFFNNAGTGIQLMKNNIILMEAIQKLEKPKEFKKPAI